MGEMWFPYDVSESVTPYGESLAECEAINELVDAVEDTQIVKTQHTDAIYDKGIVTDTLINLRVWR
jgi:hypothetical protein